MKIDSKELSKTQTELIIELSKEELQPYIDRAVVKISENTKISGFRPGKATYEALKQQVGEMTIYQEAADKAISKSLFKVIRDLSKKEENKEIEIASNPEISIEKLAPGNSLVFKAIITKIPEVEICDLDKIKVEDKEIKIEEDELNKVLDQLRDMRAKEVITSDPAKEGDKIVVNFELFLNKVPVENGQHLSYPVMIGEKKMIPGFEEKLIGMKKDDKKEFSLAFPKEYYEKNLAGKMGDFKVKCVDVFNIKKPELSDDFAKEIGFDTADKLKEQTKENLKFEKKKKEEERKEVAILEQIIEGSNFDEIPEILISRETHQIIHEIKHGVENQGLKWDDYLNHLKKKEDDLKKEYKDESIKRIKKQLALRAIAKTNNILVDDKEVEAEVEKLFKMYEGQDDILNKLKSDNYRVYLQNMLMSRKTIKFLRDKILTQGK